MAGISKDEVRRLANLAKIELSKAEEETLRQELVAILTMIERLFSIDTNGVEPTAQVSGLDNITRSDEVDETVYRCSDDDLLSRAAVVEGRQIRVPRVK